MTMHYHPRPLYDEHWEGTELAVDGTHRYLWLWQGFNIRLIAVPVDIEQAQFYDFAWCFRRDPDFVADAVLTWDSDTEDEPRGWHKRPTYHSVRRAPRREEAPEYNRPRCVHGDYKHLGCRTINCEG